MKAPSLPNLFLVLALVLLNSCYDCPDRAQTVFSFSMLNRVERIEYFGVAELNITSSERVALVRSTRSSININDVRLYAGEILTLPSGDSLLATFQGEFTEVVPLNEDSSINNHLFLVRIEPTEELLRITGSVYWATVDCDITDTFEVSHREIAPTCGDGIVEYIEPCDDANHDEEDGCTSECELGPGMCIGNTPHYWACEGEPSQCDPQECVEDNEELGCDAALTIEIEVITSGLTLPGQDFPVVTSDGDPELSCSCEETALEFECHETCTIDMQPCTWLSAASTDELSFTSWFDMCSGESSCPAMGDGGRVLALFERDESGIDLENTFALYPEDSAEITIVGSDAASGFVVVAAHIIGELENPDAHQPPPDEPAHPVLIALDHDLRIVWSRDLATSDCLLEIHDIAVDDYGHTYVAAGLVGTLDLEGGTLTVQYIGTNENQPLETVLLKFSPLGEHLWTRTLGLDTRTHLMSAALDTNLDGDLSLAVVVDEDSTEPGILLDLLLASVTTEGDVRFVQPLRRDDDVSRNVVISQRVGTAIDLMGAIYVIGSVDDDVPFKYHVPHVNEEGFYSSFMAKFSSEGEHLWSVGLLTTDPRANDMAIDGHDNLVLLLMPWVVNYDSDGELGLWHEISRRPYHSFGGRQHIAFEPWSEDIVLSATTSTGAGSEGLLLGSVTSQYNKMFEHQWTVRIDNTDPGQTSSTWDVVAAEGRVFIVGLKETAATSQQGLAIRRINSM